MLSYGTGGRTVSSEDLFHMANAASKVRRSLLTTVVLWASIASIAWARDSSLWAIHTGAFDIGQGSENLATELALEYRFPSIRYDLIPVAGVMVTAEEGFYAYGGVRYDIWLSERWAMSPQFAIGAYEKGEGKDLGGVLEFRSGLEFSYRFDSGHRIGLSFLHMSNSDTYNLNPGSNSLILTYAF